MRWKHWLSAPELKFGMTIAKTIVKKNCYQNCKIL